MLRAACQERGKENGSRVEGFPKLPWVLSLGRKVYIYIHSNTAVSRGCTKSIKEYPKNMFEPFVTSFRKSCGLCRAHFGVCHRKGRCESVWGFAVYLQGVSRE